MIIKSSFKNYELEYSDEFSFISDINNINNKFIVADRNVYNLYKESVFDKINEKEIYLIDALEENKNIETALELCRQMTKLTSKRNSVLVSFGGGIIQDITGFAANILYRGIKWIYIPTTLLAQTDSCIGGKTSLNFDEYKNLLGTFYPPDKIFVDTNFIDTLSEKDYRSGLGEIFKFSIMGGEKLFQQLQIEFRELLNKNKSSLYKFIDSSLALKKGLIEEDEFDFGVRKLLNLGHTFGHALESTSAYGVPHGQAVAFGIIVAVEIALSKKTISHKKYEWIKLSAKEIITEKIEKEYLELINFRKFLKNDKKREGNDVACIIVNDDYGAELIKITELELDEIIQKVKNDLIVK